MASLCLSLCFSACRRNDIFIQPEIEKRGDTLCNEVKGLYVLNEGNMGANKASLDFYDFTTAQYIRNIFAAANPNVYESLGDVGNDLVQYGGRLYAVINCSNLVEVMDAQTAKHIGTISCPNCRCVCFHEGYGYLTSYAGPVQVGGHQQIGNVAKFDTSSLTTIATCYVGYQPEGIAIADGKLYVANSGGYLIPNTENTLSVIDLASFREIKRVPVACNLSRLVADRHHQLWASCRGNNTVAGSKLYCINTQTDKVVDSLDVNAQNMWLDEDKLYLMDGMVDVATRTFSPSCIATASLSLERPYGLAVHPVTKDIYVADAKNYVSPGRLYCISREGKLKWEVMTGDVPAHFCFLQSGHKTPLPSSGEDSASVSPYIHRVYAYCPAPGQFINTMPASSADDTPASMAQKAEECLKNHRQGLVSLGAFGGYIVFGFDHDIPNVQGAYDLKILGNAYYAAANGHADWIGGNAEPGIVMVSRDDNGNGLPDDAWYELAGSDYYLPATRHQYQVSYYRDALSPARWCDSEENNGVFMANSFHRQTWFPQWMGDSISFTGTCLTNNVVDIDGTGTNWFFKCSDWGYVDNHPNMSKDYPERHVSEFDISWAVDSQGNPVLLDHVRFVKVYTAVLQQAGWLGETSTEIMDAWDMHALP